MRVAYVSIDPGVPVFGSKGASVHTQAVLRALVRRGDQVHLITTRPGGTPPPDLASVVVHALPMCRADDAAARERAVQHADRCAATVLDHVHTTQHLDLVYERYSLWGRTATAWAAHNRLPSLLEVNAPLVDEQARHRTLVDRAAAEEIATAALSAATAVVCVSEAVARWARGRSGDPARVHTLPNGVDTTRIRPSTRALTPATGTPFTLGFVGTLKPWHGVDTLVDATVLLVGADPSYRLLVVGDGPAADAVHTRAAAAGIGEQLEMAGAVEPAEIPAQLHRMDVGVAPYPPLPDFYFSPLKVYEYLAAGLPVVASAIGDLPATLDQGRLGVLVEPGDASCLARAIGRLRADPRRREALAHAGRARAVERHDWSGVVTTALSFVGVTSRQPSGVNHGKH